MTSPLAIELQEFTFAYPDAEVSFSQTPLNWCVPEGAFVLLLGKTGIGKTTLLTYLVPALAPQGRISGTSKLFGRPSALYSAREACQVVGYVPQNPEASIVCQTVLAELAFGLENLGIDAAVMARRIAEIVGFFGMESWIHQETATLSGGQKHLLALAAALVMRPRLLLLDEPLAQLDPVAQRTFASLLFRVNRELGVTIVVATHDPYTLASYATEAVVLHDTGLSSVPLDHFALHPWNPPAKTSASEGESVLTTRDVWFRYGKASPWVLQGMESVIRKGQSVALIGGNGAGKTTYLQLVAKLHKPMLGTVNNHLITHQAYLPQDPKMLLVCDSVEDELREWQDGAGYGDAAIVEMLEMLELVAKKVLHPMDLSGGEQQKLALGKLLLLEPSLLILDEPTKGLDYETKLFIVQLLLKVQKKGSTILMATHDLAVAAVLADRMWLLFNGSIAADERPQDFFTDALFYQVFEDPFTRAFEKREPDCS